MKTIILVATLLFPQLAHAYPTCYQTSQYGSAFAGISRYVSDLTYDVAMATRDSKFGGKVCFDMNADTTFFTFYDKNRRRIGSFGTFRSLQGLRCGPCKVFVRGSTQIRITPFDSNGYRFDTYDTNPSIRRRFPNNDGQYYQGYIN